MNNTILELAKKASSAEELISLAKEAGLDLVLEEAMQYFAKAGHEISDADIEQVTGGVAVNKAGIDLDLGIVARF